MKKTRVRKSETPPTAVKLKNILLYGIALTMLGIVFFFFGKAYREMVRYSELTNRNSSVYSDFQNLSQQINNAAVCNPELVDAGNSLKTGALFFADSQSVIEQLNALKLSVSDSDNADFLNNLDTKIKAELSWIIKSNVPDSIVEHKATARIASLYSIDSLIKQGTKRTGFLLANDKKELTNTLNSAVLWMIVFVVLSTILIIYTTLSFFRQKSKTEIKAQALNEGEQHFRHTLDNMLEGIQIHDFNWRYIYVNDALVKYSHYKKEELLGHTIMEKYPGIERTGLFKTLQQCMHERVAKHFETEFVFPDGTKTDFELSIQPAPEGIFILSADITERKKAEHQKNLFTSIVNFSDDAILSKTLDGIITTWNHGAEKIFGYASGEITGRHISMLIPAHLQQEETEIIDKIKREEIVDHYETERIRKDGKVIQVSLSISPIKDAAGKITGASKIARDITGYKEAAQKLEKTEKRFRALIENSNDVISLMDASFKIIYRSPSAFRVSGWSDEEFKNSGTNNIHPDDMEKGKAIMQELMTNPGKAINTSFRGQHKRGHYIWMEGTVMNLLQDEDIKAIVFNFREVTARIEAEQKIIKANRLYAFISNINQMIVHVKDEETLFAEACGIASGIGKFKMAWIGMFDENSRLNMVNLCSNEIAAEDLQKYSGMDFTNPLLKNTPTGRVLSTEKYFVSNDVQNDPAMSAWKKEFVKHGIKANISLPIKKFGKLMGVFGLNSTIGNFFNEEEIALLKEATGDISFALENFENTKKHKETEELVLRNEKRFRALIENSTDMKTLSSEKAELIYCSPAITKVLGYSLEEFLHTSIYDIIHPDDIAGYFENRKKILQTPGASFYFQQRRHHKNGNWVWCEGTLTNLLHEPAINALVSNFRDISEKKEIQRQQEFDKNNLNALINNTADLMWSVDRNFNLITSNQPFDELGRVSFGKTIRKGENVLSVSDTPEMLNHFKQLYERAFAGEAFTETERFNYPVEYWTEISYYPIRKGDEIIGTACHSRDITNIKKAEEHLRNSEAFSSGILNSLNSHIAVVDKTGSIIAVNETWKRFALENGDDDLLNTGVGNNYFKVCEKSAKAGVAVAAEVLRGMKEVMDEKKNVFYLEYPCHSPIERRWFGIRVIKFESEQPMIVVAHQNITERKLAEENLMKSEAQLMEAQVIAHTGSWETDFIQNKTTWSDELYTILGLEKEEEQASTELFLSFIHTDDAAITQQIVKESFNSLKDSSFTFRFIRKDGEIRYGYTERKFEFDQNKKAIRLFGIFQDITERKLAEKEREKIISDIVQRNKDLEQFSYIISHNLRAPVANILGLSAIIRDEDLEPHKHKELMNGLFHSVKKFDEVIIDLNNILNIRQGVSEKKEIVCFSKLVNDIQSSIENLIRKENAIVIFDFSGIDEMLTLKTYLHSIFYNLISNSIKYRQPKISPVIEIKSRKLENKIVLQFKDNGMGIDLKTKGDQVFRLYKRFHAESAEGKGMGLYMVKTQVEAIGGKIYIESEINKGTIFKIEFET